MDGEISTNKMGTVPVPKLLVTMGLPMVISMVLQAFYNVVDSYFVSQMPDANGIVGMGEYGVNALTLAFPIQMLMVSLGVGTGVGINALLSRSLGQNDRVRASRIAGNAIFLGVCTYIVFLLVGVFGTGVYLRSQTSDATVLGMGTAYIRLVTTLSFGLMLFTIYEKLLQASGRTGLSMVAQVAGALTNIVLDPVMIFGYWGLPAMGIRGAAYATVIGQCVSMLLAIIFHYALNRDVSHSFKYLRPDGRLILEIYKIGIPATVMQALVSIMSYGLNIILGGVSSAMVTAYGIYYKIQQFVFFATLGMNNALIPVIGFNYGRKDTARLHSSIKFGLLYAGALMVVGTVCLQVFAHQLVGIFALSPETEALCIRAMRVVTLGYILSGATITFEAIFQAFGNGVKSLLISLARLCCTLLFVWMLTGTAQPEATAWWGLPLGEVGTVAVSLLFVHGLVKNKLGKLGKNLKPEYA